MQLELGIVNHGGEAQKANKKLIAAVAFYGPDETFASKVTALIITSQKKIISSQEWHANEKDVRQDEVINHQIATFVAEYPVEKVVFTDHIIGCPHVQGVDFPYGENCPNCPYWSDKTRYGR